jgi:zinc D-Ala-D-Ala dipeptidase
MQATCVKNIKIVLLFVGLLFCKNNCFAQLQVITTTEQYNKLVLDDSANIMVNIKEPVLGLVFDLKYATKKNFTKTKLYPKVKTSYLRRDAAVAFRNATLEARTMGYRIKIFDAYRPYSVTQKMWDLINDERYVANPANGSGHNKGTTVDITLVDAETGVEIDMGTAFDDFTEAASHGYTNLSESVKKNRNILKSLMEKHGFKAFESEWWHYSFISSKSFAVLDLSFKDLKKTSSTLSKLKLVKEGNYFEKRKRF